MGQSNNIDTNKIVSSLGADLRLNTYMMTKISTFYGVGDLE